MIDKRYFTDLLFSSEDCESFVWQGIPEGDSAKDKIYATPTMFVSTKVNLNPTLDYMRELNDRGYLIGVGYNEFNPQVGKRNKQAIIAVNTFIVDIDTYLSYRDINKAIEQLKPTFVVRSSKSKEDANKYKAHLYWLLYSEDRKDINLIKDYDEINKFFAGKVEQAICLGERICDRSMTIEKIVRVPGTIHKKNSDNINKTEIIYIHDDREESVDAYRKLLDEFYESKKDIDLKLTEEISKEEINTTTTTTTEEGSRNTNTFKFSIYIFNILNLSFEEGKRLIYRENKTRNNPPLDTYELDRIINNAFNYHIKWDLERQEHIYKKFLAKFNKKFSVKDDAVKTNYVYDYGNKEHFYDLLSDKAILYRLLQRSNGRIKTSRLMTPRVYDEDLGIFRPDSGQIDTEINRIVINLINEPEVLSLFTDDRSGCFNEVKFHAYIKELRSAYRSSGLVKLVSQIEEFNVEMSEWNKDENIINCRNGVIDLNNNYKLLPHSPRYLLTESMNANFGDSRLIYKYSDMQTERDWTQASGAWSNFIYQIMDGDIEMCRLLQKLFGYSLQGDLSAHILAFFFGDGCNGKSVCLETMLKLFGGYGKATTNNMFVENLGKSENACLSELAQLFGKRYIVADEIKEGVALNESSIKNVTTGSFITAKFSHKDTFIYKPQFTSFLQGNHKPTVKGRDFGIWRRLIIVPFTRNFSRVQDFQLLNKLCSQDNLNEMLSWTLAGHALYRKEGLKNLPSKSLIEKDKYRDHATIIKSFITDCLDLPPVEIEKDTVTLNDKLLLSQYKTSITLIYEVYVFWCGLDNKYPEHYTSVGRWLASSNVASVRQANRRYYICSIKKDFMELKLKSDNPILYNKITAENYLRMN